MEDLVIKFRQWMENFVQKNMKDKLPEQNQKMGKKSSMYSMSNHNQPQQSQAQENKIKSTQNRSIPHMVASISDLHFPSKTQEDLSDFGSDIVPINEDGSEHEPELLNEISTKRLLTELNHRIEKVCLIVIVTFLSKVKMIIDIFLLYSVAVLFYCTKSGSESYRFYCR